MKYKTVISGLARTPMGGMQGALSPLSASNLGAYAVRGALERAGAASDKVDEVIMGCVLPAGQGQAPARQAAVGAEIPVSVPATTINKMCGSGMKAVMMAHDSIGSENNELVVAGGMESMTNAPHILPKSRDGLRLGHGSLLDHMFCDGLEDAFDKGRLMGSFAEQCARKYGFSREAQDEFAIESLKRAQRAISQGDFEREIQPVVIKSKKGEIEIKEDEQPGKAQLDKIPHLRPAFEKDGSVTAANSSSISDGAAALILSSESYARNHNLSAQALLLAHATHAQEPSWFTTAPVKAIEKLLTKVGWSIGDVDLFEVNEAFASVALLFLQAFDADATKVNPNGGAIAMGHPLGATGTMILGTLLDELERTDKELGLATLCVASGMGAATVIERV